MNLYIVSIHNYKWKTAFVSVASSCDESTRDGTQTVRKTPDSNFTSAPLIKRKYLIEYTNKSAFGSFCPCWRNRRVTKPHKARYIVASSKRFCRDTKTNSRLLPSSYIIFVRCSCCEFVVPLLDIMARIYTARVHEGRHFTPSVAKWMGDWQTVIEEWFRMRCCRTTKTSLYMYCLNGPRDVDLRFAASFHCWSAFWFVIWLGRL